LYLIEDHYPTLAFMKKILITAATLLVVFYACGPAAEDRVAMDRNAKRLSDSIHKWLDSALNDPVKEMGGTFPYANQPQVVTQNTAAAVTTKTVDHK
jgi:hypothetical protein